MGFRFAIENALRRWEIQRPGIEFGWTVIYGVPEHLDLTFLHGTEVIQVCLGMNQVQFHFHPEANISVEGRWELLAADGSELDRNKKSPRQEAYQLHRLVGQKVMDSRVPSPNWFALRFESGDLLRVFNCSERCESFSIQPGNIFV